ncbi:MAG: alpha/beta fold hydrolase [Hyphomicrobiaceae bacterium]
MATPHLVFIPGLLCTTALFSAQIAGLADVASVSVADHASTDTMTGLATSILAASPERFSLAGLSMGGYIAFEIMRLDPKRVERLALLDTSARPDLPEQSENRRRLVTLAGKKGVCVAAREMFPALVAPSRHDDAALRQTFLEMAEAIGADGFANQQNAIMGRPDSRHGLKDISCPTLVLVGEEDNLTPISMAQEMCDGITGSALSVVPGSGHLSTLEAPDVVTRALRTWLMA